MIVQVGADDLQNAVMNTGLGAGPIAKHVVESRPLYQGAFRLNIADQQSVALSDHLPQLAVFEME